MIKPGSGRLDKTERVLKISVTGGHEYECSLKEGDTLVMWVNGEPIITIWDTQRIIPEV